jgi:hypothetical protein
MLVNTDLPSDTLALSLQQKRLEASGTSSTSSTSSQASAATPSASSASQLDPLLQRLTETPSPVQDGGSEIEDESEANPIMNSLLQSMRGQPGTAMTAQANQLSENVLSLLQSTE